MAPKQQPGRSKQDYGTPQNFIDAACHRLRIDGFVFDFAADKSNYKAPRYWTVEDDSLSKGARQWWEASAGGWGWLNPPFEKIGPWAKLCMESSCIFGAHIAFLVPAGVGANWFRDYVDGQARVLMLNGRLAFMPDKPNWLYPKDCVLCLYSPTIKPGYEVWSWRDEIVKAAA